jgi:hypothetical protein
MGHTYPALDDKLIAFIGRQKMFFVATAPLSEDAHVNLSPKGHDVFRILGPNQVAYADLGGSGIETLAHIRENGRLTIMFCAFEGAPNILRLYGRGSFIQFDDPRFEPMIAEHFPDYPYARDIIVLDIERVADSCGWSIPFYDYKGERDQLQRYIQHKPLEEWRASRLARNAESIDGLPGLRPIRAAE